MCSQLNCHVSIDTFEQQLIYNFYNIVDFVNGHNRLMHLAFTFIGAEFCKFWVIN